MLSGQSSCSYHWQYWKVHITCMNILLCLIDSYFGEIQLIVMTYSKSKKEKLE